MKNENADTWIKYNKSGFFCWEYKIVKVCIANARISDSMVGIKLEVIELRDLER
jgi:hypothetical protein